MWSHIEVRKRWGSRKFFFIPSSKILVGKRDVYSPFPSTTNKLQGGHPLFHVIAGGKERKGESNIVGQRGQVKVKRGCGTWEGGG